MPQLHCPTCRATVSQDADRCRGCGTLFRPGSSTKPVDDEELSASSRKGKLFAVAACAVILVAALGFWLFFQVLKGLAAGH